MSDFVAEGMVYNQLWVPMDSGLRLLATSRSQTVIRRAAGQVTVKDTDAGFQLADSATSPLSTIAATTQPVQGTAAPSPAANIVMRARKVARHRVDGKSIVLAAVPDADRASRRPPRAMLILADDRIAAITEYTWAKKDGVWRPIHSRTTFLDERGQASMVFDQDARKLIYRDAVNVGFLQALPRRAGELLPAMGRLVQPDVLYAAAEEGVCITEGFAATLAASGVIVAGYAVQAAKAAYAVAATAFATAMSGCLMGVITCPAADAAAVAYKIAQASLRAAQTALGSAIVAAAAADYALEECLREWRERQQDPPESTTTGPSEGGSETDCGDGGEEWCEWTLSWPDGVLHVQRNYCWCQEGEYAL